MIDIKILKKDLKALFGDSNKVRTIHIVKGKSFTEVFITYGLEGSFICMVELNIHTSSRTLYKINGYISMDMIDKINGLLLNGGAL